jgi:hypothetical protein
MRDEHRIHHDPLALAREVRPEPREQLCVRLVERAVDLDGHLIAALAGRAM